MCPSYAVTTHTMNKMMPVIIIIMVLNFYLKPSIIFSQSLISLTVFFFPLEKLIVICSSKF